MSSTLKVPTSSLKTGDVIYASVVIDVADSINPFVLVLPLNQLSSTDKKIRRGANHTRICIVLVAGITSVQVTYAATFNHRNVLPETFTDKSMWYPVDPAAQEEGTLPPLPPSSLDTPVAHWVSLRKVHIITSAEVSLIPGLKYSAVSAAAIYQAIQAKQNPPQLQCSSDALEQKPYTGSHTNPTSAPEHSGAPTSTLDRLEPLDPPSAIQSNPEQGHVLPVTTSGEEIWAVETYRK